MFQLEMLRFIKVIEIKLTKIELFSFFCFMCVAANAFKLLCMTHLENIDRFLYHSDILF